MNKYGRRAAFSGAAVLRDRRARRTPVELVAAWKPASAPHHQAQIDLWDQRQEGSSAPAGAITSAQHAQGTGGGAMTYLGAGICWRPEIADAIEELPGTGWVEVVAEKTFPGHLPDTLLRLCERPDPARLAAFGGRAESPGAPLVIEHIAFVPAGGPLTGPPRLEAGHRLPVPRARHALDVLCENVRIAQDALPVPLALETIVAPIAWPGEELSEGQFLADARPLDPLAHAARTPLRLRGGDGS
jgi:hypothetical protein